MSLEYPQPDLVTNDPFAFIPFSQQENSRRLHRISLAIDFSDYTPPSPEFLSSIHGLQTIHSDYEFGWGDIDRLTVIIPNTPILREDTPEGAIDSIEDPVLSRIKQRGRAILKSIESERPEDLQALRAFLSTVDVLKVTDFIRNRRRPTI